MSLLDKTISIQSDVLPVFIDHRQNIKLSSEVSVLFRKDVPKS
jgi:hypothetical protein